MITPRPTTDPGRLLLALAAAAGTVTALTAPVMRPANERH
jgi:hypothetical protein